MPKLLTLILLTSAVSGCAVFDTAPSATAENSAVAPVLPQVSAEEAAAVPEGAMVEIEGGCISGASRAKTTGTVLKAGPEGIALANCVREGHSMTGTPILNKVPYVSRLYKNTGVGWEAVPVLWVPREAMSAVRVIEPPSPDDVAPAIEIETAMSAPLGVDFDFEPPVDGQEL